MADRIHLITGSDPPDRRSLREIVQDIVRDLQQMIRGEIRLARTEIAGKLGQTGQAAGFLGAAAVTGLLAAACVVTACIAALALVISVWLSALLMAILLGMIAAGSYIQGRIKLDHVDAIPQRTVETLKDNVEWAKHRTS
jgi:hypothetical protein